MKKVVNAALATALCLAAILCFTACSLFGDDSSTTTTTTVCQHLEEIIPNIDATCTETGLTEGKKCSVCQTILVEQTVIPAKGHTEFTLESLESTCTESGLTEGKKCTICNTVTVQQEIVEKADHKPQNGKCFYCELPMPSVGLRFELNNEGTAYTVVSRGTCSDTIIVIPDSYNGLPVSSIDSFAFDHCNNLTNIIFENTDGWEVNGENIDVTDSGTNATNLKTTYTNCIWCK